MSPLDPHEKDAMAMLIEEHPETETLRRQVNAAVVVSTQISEGAIIRELKIPPALPQISDTSDATLSGVDAEFENGSVCGFLLFLRGGYVEALELFSFDDSLPDFDQRYTVRQTTVIRGDCQIG